MQQNNNQFEDKIKQAVPEAKKVSTTFSSSLEEKVLSRYRTSLIPKASNQTFKRILSSLQSFIHQRSLTVATTMATLVVISGYGYFAMNKPIKTYPTLSSAPTIEPILAKQEIRLEKEVPLNYEITTIPTKKILNKSIAKDSSSPETPSSVEPTPPVIAAILDETTGRESLITSDAKAIVSPTVTATPKNTPTPVEN